MDQKEIATAVKMSESTKSRLKLGAASLKASMIEVMDDALTDYFEQGKDMLEANNNAIIAGEPIPYPRDVYARELILRRGTPNLQG